MNDTKTRTSILITAWTATLAIGFFNIIAREIFHITFSETAQFVISASLVAVGFLLTFLWKTIRPLRPFFGVFLVLIGVQWLVFTVVDQLPIYRTWLNNPSFNIYMLAEQSLKLSVTLAVIAFLFILKRKRSSFFLAKGDLSAPIEPIKWLGVKQGDNWKGFGSIAAICISLGTFAFLFIAARSQLAKAPQALLFLPAVLLAAVLNAFNEEMTYKASFLSVLEGVVGKQQALFLMAAYFGLLHFYGIPYGIVGVIMAAFLGWLLGKSMLETRGLFWAWFIHFLQDVLIFTFLAIGSVAPGG